MHLIFFFQGDGVEVTDKVPVGVVQSEEPSQHLPSELNCQSVFNDLNDQEVLYLFILSLFKLLWPFVYNVYFLKKSAEGCSSISPIIYSRS